MSAISRGGSAGRELTRARLVCDDRVASAAMVPTSGNFARRFHAAHKGSAACTHPATLGVARSRRRGPRYARCTESMFARHVGRDRGARPARHALRHDKGAVLPGRNAEHLVVRLV